MSTIKSSNETEFILSSEFYGFTTIQNYILEDPRITDNAIGLYMRIVKFQNSPTHKIYLNGLITEVNKRTKVTNAMNELINLGYIEREEIRESGRFKGYKYIVYMKSQKTSKPCEISIPTECRKTASGKTEFGKTAPKKENKLKKKITKKENNISLINEEKRDDDPHVNILLLEEKATIQLTEPQKKKVATWDTEKIKQAVELFINHGGLKFTYLEKCYKNPIDVPALTKNPIQAKSVSKNPHFTNTYSHNWDLEELEKREREYMEKTCTDEQPK